MNREITSKLEDIVDITMKSVDRDTFYRIHAANLSQPLRTLLLSVAIAAYKAGYHHGQQTVTPDHR